MTLAERLWSKVQRGAPGECWEWTGYRSGNGYGRIADETGVVTYAHRVAYRLAKPSMFNPRKHVLHACDNPGCVRPGHLFQGMHADNMRDAALKGHFARKFTDDDIRVIRADRRLQRIIAAEYGVDQTMISRIKLGKNWKHISKARKTSS